MGEPPGQSARRDHLYHAECQRADRTLRRWRIAIRTSQGREIEPPLIGCAGLDGGIG